MSSPATIGGRWVFFQSRPPRGDAPSKIILKKKTNRGRGRKVAYSGPPNVTLKKGRHWGHPTDHRAVPGPARPDPPPRGAGGKGVDIHLFCVRHKQFWGGQGGGIVRGNSGDRYKHLEKRGLGKHKGPQSLHPSECLSHSSPGNNCD